MYCPQCGSEYVSGIAECADCGVPLVDGPPPEPVPRGAAPEPVVVFSTGRADLIAIAKSILMSAGIEFAVRGEEVQDLFGAGRFPFGANLVMGPVELLVAEKDARDARELLAGLASSEPSTPDADADDDGEVSGLGSVWAVAWRWAKIAAGLIIALLLAALLWTLLSELIGR